MHFCLERGFPGALEASDYLAEMLQAPGDSNQHNRLQRERAELEKLVPVPGG